MSSFVENNISEEIQGLLFRISTGEFGSPDTLSSCSEYLTHALSFTTALDEQNNSIHSDNTNHWLCNYCTYENNISCDICEMCLKSNLYNPENESNQNNVDNNVWECLHY